LKKTSDIKYLGITFLEHITFCDINQF